MKCNFIDLTGKRFGRLTVVGIYDRTPNGCIRWRCRCDCGNEIPVFKSVLMRNNGSIKSCGCVYLDELKKHIGEKKDYLEIIGVEQIGRKGRIIVRCCCGKEKKMKLSQFYNKNVHSCGCIGVKKGKDSPNYIHGMSKTRIFNIYRDMINRCYNKNDISYKNYGGRGITVCPEWLGEKGVTNFTEWSYTNGYDEKAPRGKCTIDRIDVNGNYEPGNCRWVSMYVQSNNRRNNNFYTIDGVTKTLSEWCREYGNLCVQSVYGRLKRGMDIGQIAEKFRAYKNGGSVPALQSIFSEEQLQWLFSVLPEDIQPEALEKPFSLFRENALRLLECCQDEFEKVFYRTLIDEQKRRSIACFTESNDNSAMWGHYADSHRGFCIEYDFQKILTACSEKCADVQHCTSLMMSPAIAPVIYADVRYDASQIILPLLLSRMADLAHTAIKPFYEDLLVIVKSLLTKSSVWSYENEWRMISMLPDNTLFCRIYSLKPTSVYIGVRTDEEAANTLYQICCEKDIPCYKMVPAYLSGSFSIRPVEYEMHVEVTDRLKQKSML